MMSASATSGTLTESPTNLRYQCLQLMVQMQRKGGSRVDGHTSLAP